MLAIWATAAWKESSLVFEGLVKPLIFLTNCSEAARISSSVAGGAKLKRGLMLRHIVWSFQQGLDGPHDGIGDDFRAFGCGVDAVALEIAEIGSDDVGEQERD
jgi:hypothetical protein